MDDDDDSPDDSPEASETETTRSVTRRRKVVRRSGGNVLAWVKKLTGSGFSGREESIEGVVALIRSGMKSEGVDPVEHGLILRVLEQATGLKKKELNLPPPVTDDAFYALAEQADRRHEMDGNPWSCWVDSNDQLDMARRFLKASANIHNRSEIVFWNEDFLRHLGSHWAPVPSEVVRAHLYEWLASKSDLTSDAPLKPERADVDKLEDALRAVAILDLPSAPAWVDDKDDSRPLEGADDPNDMIAFRNGLLYVPTREFSDPTRGFFNLNACDFDFDRDAPKPTEWIKFLSDLWGDDIESIETLQEIAGLALTADTSHQKIFLLVGPKRSGKGTLARVLTKLVGAANVVAPTLNGLGQHFGLESLIGKQLAIISDARLGGRTDASAVTENLLRISGEDRVSAPRKHRSDWTAQLATRFLLLTNEIPALLDQSGALASRFIILSLTKSFYGREDRGLTQRLERELPGICLWALEGLVRLRARGHFRQPAAAAEAVRQIELLGSPIKAFISERCVVEPGATVECARLYLAWEEWTVGQGRDHPGTAPMLGRNLSAALPGIRTTQPRVDGKQVRHYEGIRLTDTR